MYDFSKLNNDSSKVADWLKNELGVIRAGRANPQLVEEIKIDYYGSPTPIKHIATITIQDAKTIIIQPWDKKSIPLIEKAISVSQAGVNPISDGDKVRVSLPELTGERRTQLTKLVGEKLEEAKISLRKLRASTLDDIDEKEKNKQISEDEKFRLKDELQKKVDEATKRLEDIADKKKLEINS